VRELRNALERAAILCEGDVIYTEHVPEDEHIVAETRMGFT